MIGKKTLTCTSTKLTLYYSCINKVGSFTFPFNPLTPGAFCKKIKRVFCRAILADFRLDFDQISFNPVENAFARRRLPVLSTSIAFYGILARACAEIQILRREGDLCLKAFRFLNFFFRLSFFSFSFLFAGVIALLLGLLSVKKFLRKRHRDGQFLRWSSQVWRKGILP